MIKGIAVGGTERRALHFHRFRSRGGEKQPDAAGALLRVSFRQPIAGPLAIGFGSHFGLGLFKPEEPLAKFLPPGSGEPGSVG